MTILLLQRIRSTMTAFIVTTIIILLSQTVLSVRGTEAGPTKSTAMAASTSNTNCPLPTSAYVLMKFDLMGHHGKIKIQTVPETLRILEELQGPLAVVSIAGMYRTGKSFLLNQLMPSNVPKNVFSVGHTVQSHTEDVSVYIVPPCALAGSPLKDTSLLYLDTPGLFAPNRAALFDSQLMAILNLVSSVLIYNTKDVVNRESIKQLSNAIEAASVMAFLPNSAKTSKKSTSNKDRLDRPHLLWVMQNFGLSLQNSEGEPITSEDYLQGILRQTDESANFTTDYTQQFAHFFKSQDTAGLPFPGKTFTDSKHLDTFTDAQFSAEYREARDELRTRLAKLVSPKQLGATMLSGSTLSTLMQSWVEEMINSSEMKPPTSPDALLKHIAEKELERIIRKYENLLDLHLPISDDSLQSKHEKALATVLAPFKQYQQIGALSSSSDGDSSGAAEFIEQVKSRLAEELAGNREKNKELIDQAFQIALEGMKKEIGIQITDMKLPTTSKQLSESLTLLHQFWQQLIEPFSTYLPHNHDATVEGWTKEAIDACKQKSAIKSREIILAKLQDELTKLGSTVTEKRIHEVESASNQEWNEVLTDLFANEPAARVDVSASYTTDAGRLVEVALSSRLKSLDEKSGGILAEASTRFAAFEKGPTEIQTIDQVAEDIKKQWQTILTDLEVDTASSPIHTSFTTSLTNLHTIALSRNLVLSTAACVETSQQILTTVENESTHWMETGFETYRFQPRIKQHLTQLRQTPFCTGPGLQATSVDVLFQSTESKLLQQLSERNQYGVYFLFFVDLLAAWCLFSLCRQRGMLFHSWGSNEAPGFLGHLDRNLSRLSLLVAAAAAILIRLIPESDSQPQLTYGVISVLIIFGLIGLRVSWKTWRTKVELHEKSEV